MDQISLGSRLADLLLPEIHYFDRVDSTNAEAQRWIDKGAPDRGLVVANEQSSGRGRLGRHWYTPPGAGLAFSLILHAPPMEAQYLPRLTGLGALATRTALQKEYKLPALVKWPNDVLINQRKVSGILAEASWSGDALKAVIVGIGINIAPESISAVNLTSTELNYPATCVENELGYPIDRVELLHAVLYECLEALQRLTKPDFIHEWETALAFRDQFVILSSGIDSTISGKLVGLSQDGALILLTSEGRELKVEIGEMHLKPTTSV